MLCIIFVSFLTCLGGTFFQAYVLSFFYFGDLFLFSFWLTWLLEFFFGIHFALKTFSHFRLVSLFFSSSADRATIACSPGNLASHLSLVHICLYFLSANIINLSLSKFFPSLYLYSCCWLYLTNYLSPSERYPLNRFDIIPLHLSPLVVSVSY